MTDPIYVDAVITTNVNPGAAGTALVGDGLAIADTGAVLLVNENAGANNGPWIYDQTAGTLSRPPSYPSGATVNAPIYVEVAGGDTYAGTTWALASPSTVTVDTTATTWTNALSGASVAPPNTVLAGPPLPYYSDGLEEQRNLVAYDLPLVLPNQNGSARFSHPIADLLNLNLVSLYVPQTAPWANGAALLAALADHTDVVLDMALDLTAAVAIPSGRRIDFKGSGRGGPVRIVQKNPAASVFVLDGAADVEFRGKLVIKYPARAASGVKAVRGAGVSRLRIESLETEGVDIALSLTGALDDIDVDNVGVASASTDVALAIAQSGTTGQESVRVRRARNQPAVTTIGDADFACTPYVHGKTIICAGAMTADRTLSIAASNRIGSAELTFIHNATGGFRWNVAGLVTLIKGQRAKFTFSGDGVATLVS